MSLDDKLQATYTDGSSSPFLPSSAVQFAWDSVSLTSILSCPRQYQYRIIEGRVPLNPNYAIALVFGILFHRGLELYHKARAMPGPLGMTHDEALFAAVKKLLADEATQTLPRDHDIDEMAASHDADEDDGITLRNSRIRTVYHLIRAVVWYLDNYEHDRCHTVLLANGKPAVELSFRIPLSVDVAGTPFTLCGHIDRVVEYEGFNHPTDYKTTKSLTRQFFEAFQLSHQISGYISAGQVLLDQPLKSALIDGIALQVGGVKFSRAFSQRSSSQLTEYSRLLTHVSTVAQMYAEQQYWPMNTAACYFCEFKEICRLGPSHRERYLDNGWKRAPGWNPLSNR